MYGHTSPDRRTLSHLVSDFTHPYLQLNKFYRGRKLSFSFDICNTYCGPSIYDAWIDQLQSIHEDIENGNAAVVNAVVNTIMNFDIGTKWKITHSMSVFGADSPLALIQKLREYSMYDIAHKIKCPTLLFEMLKNSQYINEQVYIIGIFVVLFATLVVFIPESNVASAFAVSEQQKQPNIKASNIYQTQTMVTGKNIKNLVILIPNEAHEDTRQIKETRLLNQTYLPENAVVNVGTKVAWLNADAGHRHSITLVDNNTVVFLQLNKLSGGLARMCQANCIVCLVYHTDITTDTFGAGSEQTNKPIYY